MQFRLYLKSCVNEFRSQCDVCISGVDLKGRMESFTKFSSARVNIGQPRSPERLVGINGQTIFIVNYVIALKFVVITARMDPQGSAITTQRHKVDNSVNF